MDALIFDFDGVIVDSEPLHMSSFAAVVEPYGIGFTEPEYRQRYLGLDDFAGLRAMFADHDKPIDQALVDELVARKTALLKAGLDGQTPPLDGVLELIDQAADRGIPMGICSGALREEILVAVKALNLADRFGSLVAAEDVQPGKPQPGCYIEAMRRLAQATGQTIRPEESWAIEDSPTGIAAARGAGMKVLAITSSYPAGELAEATRIVDRFAAVDLDELSRV